MRVDLQRLIDDGVMAAMHQALASTVSRLVPEIDPRVTLAAALVSEQLARGHVCLDLARVADVTFPSSNDCEQYLTYQDWPEIQSWVKALSDCPCVATRDCSDTGENLRHPLVLDVENRRLYLSRYWFFQQQLAGDFVRRIDCPPLARDETQLAADVASLFPDRVTPGGFDQCVAAANAVDRRFAVITGGPGTGKTTTVAKLIALCILQQSETQRSRAELRVLLMAPTGKAAQRLNESLGRATQQLAVPDRVRAQLNDIKAGTIHRLLGWTSLPPERGGPFYHSADFPLEADVVLVDESSMVDIGLMWHLVSAIPPKAAADTDWRS